MTLTRRHFLVEGRVQGVGFRHSAARIAAKLDVTGSICNLPNGLVEVQAQGKTEDVNKMEEWLRHGPALADITRLTAIEKPLEKEEHSFLIRYF